METRRIYYENAHQTTFDAKVFACTQGEGGWEVVLDATAFYPEGGGQPCDLGALDGASVLFVKEIDGQVVHLCDRPLDAGNPVTGEIDWLRRLDLMQQHSGEHMVSGMVHKLYGYHNVGFHMGAEVVTIDFDGIIPPEDLPKIEDAVNAAIWENLPVRCWYPSPEELPHVPYRRKRDLPWPVRIVDFPGIDLCACCGTHVKTTGEIGFVKLFSCIKFHEGVRIEMACGQRALTLLTRAWEQNKQVSHAFSAKADETGLAARRMNDALGAEKFRSAALEKRLFAAIAEGYAGQAFVLHFEEDLSPAANRELCDAIAKVCGLAVTCSGNDESGYSLCIMSSAEDVKALGSAACAALGGRGGGKPNAFQGATPAKKQEIDAYFMKFREK